MGWVYINSEEKLTTKTMANHEKPSTKIEETEKNVSLVFYKSQWQISMFSGVTINGNHPSVYVETPSTLGIVF